MAKKKMQLRYVRGAIYRVIGASGGERKLEFVGRFKIDGKEHLIFKPQRKAKKLR